MNRKDSRPLGDIRAENDAAMLGRAFVSTADFRSLVESYDRPIVVGRRGTGKSALVYRLTEYWKAIPGALCLVLAPEEEQMVGLRAAIEQFGGGFRPTRAAAKRLWTFGLLMECASRLSGHFKFGKSESADALRLRVRAWEDLGHSFAVRLRRRAQSLPFSTMNPAYLIGDLAQLLEVDLLERQVRDVLSATKAQCVLLIDRIDEGFETDELGIGIVDGLVNSVTEMQSLAPSVIAVAFLRDNVFRAVSRRDEDYSRNIEGQVLRLHWDEKTLLEVISRRLRFAFDLTLDRDEWVWNRCVCRELSGPDGFRGCLRLTLYRPRDLLSLLNEAFFRASQDGRKVLLPHDIESGAREISKARLDDLRKEYDVVVPGVRELTGAFSGAPCRSPVSDVVARLSSVVSRDDHSLRVQQTFAFFEHVNDAVRALYGIGFLGLEDRLTKVFAFCHDGREPRLDLSSSDLSMIHPCYWKALDVQDGGLDAGDASEVFDDYEIEVSSVTVDQRSERVGTYIGEFGAIPRGESGASAFEVWCHKVIRAVFAGGLRNVELHPNKSAASRRDIVGTNMGETPAWKRARNDFDAKQVVFEVKNYETPNRDDYLQVLGYLGETYGRLGFIVYRSDSHDITKERELPWMKDLYFNHRVLVVKLSSKFLMDMLSKLRNPEKFGVPDEQLDKLFDRYVRLYLGQPTNGRRRRG